jgi:hypothetical protein
MPIRFYCPFCDRLLGISRHKIGAVVECPSCHGRVGVPSDRPGLAGSSPPPLPGLRPVPLASPASSDIVLTPPQVLALGLALLLLLGLFFAAGLLLGSLS